MTRQGLVQLREMQSSCAPSKDGQDKGREETTHHWAFNIQAMTACVEQLVQLNKIFDLPATSSRNDSGWECLRNSLHRAAHGLGHHRKIRIGNDGSERAVVVEENNYSLS